MLQASPVDGVALDPFAFGEDGLPAAEVDIGGRQVAEALMVAGIVVMLDEGRNLPFEIAGHIVILEQDAVLEGSGASARSCPASGHGRARRERAACPCRRAASHVQHRYDSHECLKVGQ